MCDCIVGITTFGDDEKCSGTHFPKGGLTATGNDLEEQRCTISNANSFTLGEYVMKAEFIGYGDIKIFSSESECHFRGKSEGEKIGFWYQN